MIKFPDFLIMFYIILLIGPLLSIFSKLSKTIKYVIILFTKIKLGDELYNLSPCEFKLWCSEFLKTNGYSNVVVSPSRADDGIDIKCTKNSEIFYIECKRYWFSKEAPFKVDENVIKKLIGAMTTDKVTNGIIITTGIITDEAKDFIITLPEEINLIIYDGSTFDTSYELRPFKLINAE